jgi:hypothetical protein
MHAVLLQKATMTRHITKGRCLCASAALAALLAASIPVPALGQGLAPMEMPADEPGSETAWSFAPGETATYSVAFGRFKLGEARLTVQDIQTIDGREVVRTSLQVEGGPPFYRIENDFSSWIDTEHFRSIRFERRIREGSRRTRDRYELDPVAGVYTAESWSEELESYEPSTFEDGGPMPEDAIDEIAFLFLVRTLLLEPGDESRMERYFKPQSNPIVVRVLRREEIRVPAGRYQTIVVEPIIPELEVFGQDRKPRVWISDDERRIIVKVQTSAAIGAVALNLTDYEEGSSSPE